jgi:hypothetical protein
MPHLAACEKSLRRCAQWALEDIMVHRKKYAELLKQLRDGGFALDPSELKIIEIAEKAGWFKK